MIPFATLSFSQPHSIDDGLIFEKLENGRVRIQIVDDMYGDSETGFGASLDFYVEAEQVKEIKDFFNNNF